MFLTEHTITVPQSLRFGTGTGDIIRLCKEKGLREPEFVQEEHFKTIIWRTLSASGDRFARQDTRQDTRQAVEEIPEAIKRVILVLKGEMKRAEIQQLLGLKDRENFVLKYLTPSLDSQYIKMTIPEIPNHKEQRYRLTDKGIAIKKKLK